MKKSILLLTTSYLLLTACSTTHHSDTYVVKTAKPKALVSLEGIRGTFLLTPPPGKSMLQPGDTISILSLKKLYR